VKGADGVGECSVVRKAIEPVRRKEVSGIEDENPAISEIEFGRLCRLRRSLRSGFAILDALTRCGSPSLVRRRPTTRWVEDPWHRSSSSARGLVGVPTFDSPAPPGGHSLMQLGTGAHFRGLGKGSKARCTPLHSDGAARLTRWLARLPLEPTTPGVPTACGQPMSSDVLQRLVAGHVRSAGKTCPSLRRKKVTPHPSPFVRDSSLGVGDGHSDDPRTARSRRSRHDATLHACGGECWRDGRAESVGCAWRVKGVGGLVDWWIR